MAVQGETSEFKTSSNSIQKLQTLQQHNSMAQIEISRNRITDLQTTRSEIRTLFGYQENEER